MNARRIGLAYIAFARENPEDVAVIEMHESTSHPHPLTTDHLALEGTVVGVFREGIDEGILIEDRSSCRVDHDGPIWERRKDGATDEASCGIRGGHMDAQHL